MQSQDSTWYEQLFRSGDYFRFWVNNIADPLISAERTLSEVAFIKSALSLPPKALILDLCCGHGRHSILLAEAGYRMSGLDFSRADLRLAQEAAKKQSLDIQWLEADMRQLPLAAGGSMDGVISMFTSFGYFEDDSENQTVLNGIGRLLKPGGRFLLDVPNLIGRMRQFRESDWTEADGTVLLRKWEYDVERSRINDHLTILEPDGSRRLQTWSIRLYSCAELKSMLERAGLSPIEVWGGLDATELTLESPRMVILSEKSKDSSPDSY